MERPGVDGACQWLCVAGNSGMTRGWAALPLAVVANGKWPIGSHYPTQAKVRLEWGTQHMLRVWQKLLRISCTSLYTSLRMRLSSWKAATPLGSTTLYARAV
jgi:hypothetical protein